MDPRRPHALTILGQDYVAWHDRSANTWRAARDRCPHRLAPMSEGRLTEDGNELACSYQCALWFFDVAALLSGVAGCFCFSQ
jgi:phenylpropionate dioxygenase-like ring-hydroxylating dioxygenase large terminal subunit